MKAVEILISEVLGVPRQVVTDDLQFQSIPEWDSLRHVDLMLALEAQLDVEIDADQMVELSSVSAIRSFVATRKREPGST